ncbi:hypothetical protein ABZT51_26635 [Streptomyces sp. NPDC005373]|uniref:hypothetical protein n=1 Tax=Streptomyces sp. NPDC005373 TaxID=3156879 RepID=UPI0033BF19B3
MPIARPRRAAPDATPPRILPAQLPGDHVHFPPVANGLDYLSSVVQHLQEDQGQVDARALKYAVLHLAAGAEVLLKARLQFAHWSLVFANPGKAKKTDLAEGTLNSCTPAEARERLVNIVEIPVSKRDAEALENLAKARNALQHYGLVGQAANRVTVENLTAKVLHFLIEFLDEHLLPCLDEQDQDRAEQDLEPIREGLITIRGYVEERLASLAPQLGPHRARTLQCPQCESWALVVKRRGEDTELLDFFNVCCLLCETYRAPDESALKYGMVILGRDPFSPDKDGLTASEMCPQCETRSLVRGAHLAAAPDMLADFCFDCAAVVSSPTPPPGSRPDR